MPEVRVQVTAGWSADTISITISDDGPGFSPQMLARVGDPFLTTRPTARETGDYEGMGLGLFIAKTLLERSGGQISFGNGGPGAVIRVSWPRDALEETGRTALGENPKITK